MSTQWIAQQILAIRRAAEPTRVAASRPRGVPGSIVNAGSSPAGVMREGSATHAVWTYLHARRERMPGWVTRQQIVVAVGRHHKAVDWALVFLRAVRLVEASQDARCSRYLRYRAIKGGGAD